MVQFKKIQLKLIEGCKSGNIPDELMKLLSIYNLVRGKMCPLKKYVGKCLKQLCISTVNLCLQ